MFFCETRIRVYMPKRNTIYVKMNLKDKNYFQVNFYKKEKIKTIWIYCS